VGIRLLTRNGNDWSARFPLVVEAVNHLKVRSCLIVCLIDGEEEVTAQFQKERCPNLA
jgi:ATP-dependent DNA ligase